MGTAGYAPPGWPEQVRPPGVPGWETTATAFLLDACPPDYRGYPVLRRHPVVLAAFAVQYVEGQLAASRDGLARVRVRLADQVAVEVVQAAAESWQRETARLVRTRRAVLLVEEALRGRLFAPRM
ncbi:hypothetical protein DT076_02650 [Desertihabitans brevis]|uniref:Uncharacterized protein n=1 Tax=Desertihabitans brevis TaxID=2268447 RepID=A0A367Z264_9ACTN|nr:hypothetical protein [Desertihabitans brevis]RCK71342.1 hypothetical protein DT076_02650 [Desertihabitans brevis]